MSSGLMTSSIPTIADTDTEPSLMASAAICEWQSMMPGIKCWPVASMILAPDGTMTFSPTSVILPSTMMTEPMNLPALPMVQIVAF